MSNLMPEKRLDKNGNLVTRHVKSAPIVSGVSRIPKPNIEHKQTEVEALVAFASPKDRATFTEAVESADPELVSQLNRFYEAYKPSGRITREIADQTINIIESKTTRHGKRYAELLHNHFDFLKSIDCLNSTGVGLVNGLIDVQDRELRGKEPMTMQQQQAILKVTKAMYSDNPNKDPMRDIELRIRNDMEHVVLGDSDLIHIVLELPNKADEIAEMVASGASRPAQIKAALDDNIQQPLLGGAL